MSGRRGTGELRMRPSRSFCSDAPGLVAAQQCRLLYSQGTSHKAKEPASA